MPRTETNITVVQVGRRKPYLTRGMEAPDRCRKQGLKACILNREEASSVSRRPTSIGRDNLTMITVSFSELRQALQGDGGNALL